MTKEEVDDLIYASEYRSASRSRKNEFMIDLRIRRLICRVCKLKFATRRETQEHLKREHRRVQARG